MKESLNTEFQELEQALQREQLRSCELEDQLSRLQTKHQHTVEKLKVPKCAS